MKFIGARFAEFAGQCHPLSLAALGLLVLVVAFHVTMVRPQQTWLAQLDTKLSYQSRNAMADTRVLKVAAPARRLDDFYAFFNREQTITDWLAGLHSIARNLGLDLSAADYKLEPTGAGRLNRYQVTMPLKANSAQVRAFVDNALASVPVLSLDRVVFRKQKTTDNFAEAEVTFSLYILPPP